MKIDGPNPSVLGKIRFEHENAEIVAAGARNAGKARASVRMRSGSPSAQSDENVRGSGASFGSPSGQSESTHDLKRGDLVRGQNPRIAERAAETRRGRPRRHDPLAGHVRQVRRSLAGLLIREQRKRRHLIGAGGNPGSSFEGSAPRLCDRSAPASRPTTKSCSTPRPPRPTAHSFSTSNAKTRLCSLLLCLLC